MDTETQFETVKREQNERYERLKPLLRPLAGILKVKTTKNTGVKTIALVKGWKEKRKAPDYKRGFSAEYTVMQKYREACDADEQVRILIELDDYYVVLDEKLALILIDEKDLIADIAAHGWNVFFH